MAISGEILAHDKNTVLQYTISKQQRMDCSSETVAHDKISPPQVMITYSNVPTF